MYNLFQGRRVAPDASPHINSVQFYMMSQSILMGSLNSFII